MRKDAELDVWELIAAFSAAPKSLFLLSALGGVPAMIGVNALLITPRFKRMLFEKFADNEQAIQFIKWAIVPVNAIGLLIIGFAFSLPLAMTAAKTLKQRKGK